VQTYLIQTICIYPIYSIYRGYVVSPFGQDGFAILPAAKILESLQLLDPSHGLPGDLEPDA
jgi:hypothetical protein